MRKWLFALLAGMSLCLAPAGAQEGRLPNRSTSSTGSAAAAGSFEATGKSMFIWGIALFVVIAVLACSIHSSTTAH